MLDKLNKLPTCRDYLFPLFGLSSLRPKINPQNSKRMTPLATLTLYVQIAIKGWIRSLGVRRSALTAVDLFMSGRDQATKRKCSSQKPKPKGLRNSGSLSMGERMKRFFWRKGGSRIFLRRR